VCGLLFSTNILSLTGQGITSNKNQQKNFVPFAHPTPKGERLRGRGGWAWSVFYCYVCPNGQSVIIHRSLTINHYSLFICGYRHSVEKRNLLLMGDADFRQHDGLVAYCYCLLKTAHCSRITRY
jgi:hypothetical protein